jgi:molybdopterin molybdotransferase
MKADWISAEEAMRRVVDGMVPLAPEACTLGEARGRVLAETIVSPIDLPRWTNSAMDGYAVRGSDVGHVSKANPVTLPVVDDIPAGAFPKAPLEPGTAARVMTGGPVPEGADTVIRVEHTDGGTIDPNGRARVTILNAQDAGRNLRRRGEEIARGDVALEAGLVLTPASLGVAASVGYARLSVIRRPVVGLLSSGDELVEVEAFEEVLAGRKIVSSNSYTLAAQLSEAGCIVRSLGIAADTPESLRASLGRARGCDALVTSAGISVGEHDYVKQVLLEYGAEVEFWRVRMRPGSPFAFGRIGALGGIPWFGLPGNPVSSAITFELFARPALSKMSGRPDVFRRRLAATLLDDYEVPPGLTHFVRVRLERDETGGFFAHLSGAQGSGMLTSMARADGLLIIPEDRAGGRAGEVFPVIPFDSGLLGPVPDS